MQNDLFQTGPSARLDPPLLPVSVEIIYGKTNYFQNDSGGDFVLIDTISLTAKADCNYSNDLFIYQNTQQNSLYSLKRG